jgi:Putative bacterial sensory transduction regulator
MKLKALSLILALGGASPAISAPVVAENPQAIADLLKDIGYRAELTKDDTGDPKIESAAAGASFSIYFYGCTDGKDCSSIQFSSGFDLDNALNLSSVNDWNTRKRYGKVYTDDDGDPYIELDINLAGGGISEDSFRDSLESWERLLSDFQEHIDW